MAPARKVRGDAKLAQLTPAQRELLRVWLEDENETYAAVVRLVYHQFGLNVSKSAVGAYYKRHLLPDRYDDDNEAAAFLAALPAGQFDAAIVRHAKALAFNALARPVPQIQTASRLLDLVHRVQRQEIAEKRLALEQRRVALKEAELASRPPRATSKNRQTPPLFPAYSSIPQPLGQPQIDAPQPSLATPDSGFPASVASEPSPFPSPLDSASPAPLQPSSTLNSGLPPLPAVQALLKETPPDSPRFPAYSKLEQPHPEPSIDAPPGDRGHGKDHEIGQPPDATRGLLAA